MDAKRPILEFLRIRRTSDFGVLNIITDDSTTTTQPGRESDEGTGKIVRCRAQNTQG